MNADAIRALVEELLLVLMHYMPDGERLAVAYRARLDALLAEDWHKVHPNDDLLTWLKRFVAEGHADHVLRHYRGMRCAPDVMAYVRSLELPREGE